MHVTLISSIKAGIFSSSSFAYCLPLFFKAAHARRPLHKIHVVFLFFRFVGKLLEHPVWGHLQLPAH